MKKSVMTAVAAVVCAAMGLCACSSEGENAFTGDETKEPEYQAKLNAISPEAYNNVENLDLEPGTYISVIGKEDESAYWKQVKKGVEQAAADLNEELGYSGDDKINVIFNAPGEPGDIDEQVNILDEELARYPDVIAISSIDGEASAVQFDLATMNGIPVVAFESGNTYQGIQSTCTTDNAKAAADAAKRLCESVDEEGEVVLIAEDSVSNSVKEQISGFTQELSANHLDVTFAGTIYMDQLDSLKRQAAAEELDIPYEEVVKAAASVSGEENAAGADGEDDTQKAAELLEQVDEVADKMEDSEAIAWYFGQHPELKGCLATSAEASQLVLNALDSADGDNEISVIGFDAGSEQLEALENGELDGLIVQNPFGMGYAAVVASARTVLQIGNEARVDTGYVWVDQENMDNENIRAMLYE